MDELVVADGLGRRFGTSETATLALRDATFRIGTGEYLAIVGRSGSGKSTLLNLLGLLDRPSEGRLHLLGERADHLDDRRRAALRNRHIGFVFQFHHLLGEFSVRENLLMPVRIGGGREDRAARAWHGELAELLGITDILDRPADRLSGGQKQRVAIGRALANRPMIVLADEPTGNLDTQNATAVNELFRRVHRSLGTTFAIVTHDPGMADLADRVIEVRDGTIARDTGRRGEGIGGRP
jgi:lipoprotein-releasing system ATP-binding protein